MPCEQLGQVAGSRTYSTIAVVRSRTYSSSRIVDVELYVEVVQDLFFVF